MKEIKLNILVGICLIAIGIICNQWVIGWLFTPDGVIDRFLPKMILWFFQLYFILTGVAIFIQRRKISKKDYIFYALIFLLIFGFTICVDFLLGLFGFPCEFVEQLVHPANYTEYRKSIFEFEYEFKTNSQGLRYKEIPLAKQSLDEKRIFVVGDSFTEGWGVEQDKTFSSLLESYYSSSANKVYFINAGQTGAGPLRYMHILFKVGVKYNIEGVLVCLHANDVIDTTSLKEFIPRIHYKRELQGLRYFLHRLYPRIYTLFEKYERACTDFKQKSVRRDIMQAACEEARKRGISQKLIQDWAERVPKNLLTAANRGEFNGSILTFGLLQRDYFSASLDIDSASAMQRWQNMKHILNLMVNECRNRGIEVAVIYIPYPFQHNPDFHKKDNPWISVGMDVRSHWLTNTTKLQRYLQEWSKEISVPYLDLTDEFRKAETRYDGDINYPLDGHLTALGHEIAAKVIAKWLNEINFLRLRESPFNISA